jgi:hypothetical protein
LQAHDRNLVAMDDFVEDRIVERFQPAHGTSIAPAVGVG